MYLLKSIFSHLNEIIGFTKSYIFLSYIVLSCKKMYISLKLFFLKTVVSRKCIFSQYEKYVYWYKCFINTREIFVISQRYFFSHYIK